MKWYLLISGILVLLLLIAGCLDQTEENGDGLPPPPVQGPKFTAGDIVSKIGVQEEPLWLILSYDNTTDKYERAFIYKKADGTWGYRKDSKSDTYPRADMEKLYPLKVAHVKVSLVPITSGTVTPTMTIALESAPEITSITPNSSATGSLVTITNLAGKHFASGATVMLAGASSPSIIATNVGSTDTKITCTFDLINATTGKRDVIVTNPDGQSAILHDGFIINNPAPVIGTISPIGGTAGETLTITITGANFKNPAMVFIVKEGREIDGGNVQVKNSNLLTAALAIPKDVDTGTWGVIVRNVIDDQNSTSVRKFTIRNAT